MSYKVADTTLAAWGRKEIILAEKEMPGLLNILEIERLITKDVLPAKLKRDLDRLL
ncbi:MAG: hypothetical protein EXS55_00425 [Candidatus Magasanikbacteria bacterium]|nr:hypothetical protein [Candidatus Magasanikbacteria bacterium]